jgi:hypothetical protein
MIIAKLTILLVVLTLIVGFIAELWASTHPLEVAAIGYPDWFCLFFCLLLLLDIIGTVASAIYLLFFYW